MTLDLAIYRTTVSAEILAVERPRPSWWHRQGLIDSGSAVVELIGDWPDPEAQFRPHFVIELGELLVTAP